MYLYIYNHQSTKVWLLQFRIGSCWGAPSNQVSLKNFILKFRPVSDSIISYVVLSNFDNIFVVSFIIEKSRFPGASGGFEINSNIINKTAFFLGDDINLADYLDEVFCLVTKIKELFFLILIPRHNFPKFGWLKYLHEEPPTPPPTTTTTKKPVRWEIMLILKECVSVHMKQIKNINRTGFVKVIQAKAGLLWAEGPSKAAHPPRWKDYGEWCSFIRGAHRNFFR